MKDLEHPLLVRPEHGFRFPERQDAIRAAWWPLYVEPMAGSGERICVAVAVANESASIVVPVPGTERLRCLYGKDVEFLHFLVTTITNQLEFALQKRELRLQFLQRPTHLPWKPAVEGVFLGEISFGIGNDLNDIAKSAFMMCASLVEKLSDETEESSENLTHKRLEKNVRYIAARTRPDMAIHFERFRRAGIDKRKIDFGYVSPTVAVNFAVLTPNQLTECIRTAKAKLWDLEALQTRYADEEFSAGLRHWELMLHVPDIQDPTVTERGYYNCRDSVTELEEEIADRNLAISDRTTPEAIAEHLIDVQNMFR